MASLTDLAAEIICIIIDELPLSSHLDFACTCRKLAAASQHVLRRHQEAHRRFQAPSDLDPSTVPTLLQSAFGGDPIPAWHVRSFEVWRDRTTWSDWTTYSLTTPCLESQDDGVSDMDVLSFQPLLERVGQYMDWFDEHAIEEIDREKALNQIESGHDGLLKALLFAKLPRLRDLKVVPRAADKHRGSTLWWLKTLLSLSKGIGFEERAESECASENAESECASESAESECASESVMSQPGPVFDCEWLWMRDRVLGHIERMDIDKDQDTSSQDSEPNWGRGEQNGPVSKDFVEQGGELDSDDNEMAEPEDQDMSKQEQVLERLERMEICEDLESSKQGSEPDSDHSGQARLSKESDSSSESNSESSIPTNPAIHLSGFISLRRVAIGITTDTWMDDQTYPCSLLLVRCLFLLPNLDTLYFNGLRCDGEDHFEEDDDIRSCSDSESSPLDYDQLFTPSSSVKHLFLEGMECITDSDNDPIREMLYETPRELLTVAIKHAGGSDSDEFWDAGVVVDNFAKAHGTSLQSLMWYGYRGFRSHRRELFQKSSLKQLHALKHVSYHVQDLPMFYKDECRPPFENANESYADHVSKMFPRSLECLVLLGDASKQDKFRETDPDGLLLLECVIIHMIGRLSNLKAIFLEGVERATGLEKGSTSFERAIAAGKAKGVEVYTSRNRPVQHGISFPEPMEKWDMKTGNFPSRQAGNWVFDPYSGRRVLRDPS